MQRALLRGMRRSAARRCHGGESAGSAALSIVVVSCLVGGASAADLGATVTGGTDADGHTYQWTVTNSGTSPIVEVRIPHYRASFCLPPPEWTSEASTYIVNVGVADRPGECVGRAPLDGGGIMPGRSGVFRLQVASGGARRGVGSVHVRFANGSQTEIAGVEVPQSELVGDQYVSVIGLTLIFGVVIGVQMLRRRYLRRTPRT